MNNDLLVPGEVTSDPDATEVIRAWVANDQLICALRPTQWADASAWGIVLADAARHIANAIQEEKGTDPAETLASVREMFNLELSIPPDSLSGNFVE